MKLTAAIIAKNEALVIEACIQSVLFADEILILDSGSTDGTQALCKKYPVKLIETDWPGFAAQRARALNLVTTDWVLFIDADERVTPELQINILATIDNPQGNVAFRIERKASFLGYPIKHYKPWQNDWQLRLHRKDAGQFNDRIIHEAFEANGNIGVVSGTLIHHSYYCIANVLDKLKLYSELTAKKDMKRQKRAGVKYAIYRSIRRFLNHYFLQGGILDKIGGLLLCINEAQLSFYRTLYLTEMKNKNH